MIMFQDNNNALDAAKRLFEQDGAKPYEVEHFARQHGLVERGFNGYIPEDSIVPLTRPHSFDELCPTTDAQYPVASLKLNGGLGTTMGLKGPKSLLPIKSGHTFLSLVLMQYEHGLQGNRLLLMNSFNTHEPITQYLKDNNIANVTCFQQGRVPRLLADSLQPLQPSQWGQEAWCPPGHGQLIDILMNGLADELIGQGIRYLFVSNIDNLGAIVDNAIPEYMAEHGLPLLMEVCQRQPSDRKGGHVATDVNSGKLLLRESNMTSAEDIDAFQDISKHQYFNTNNLWIDLTALNTDVFDHKDLPLIVNRKHVVKDTQEADVIQFETALGTAIANFTGASTLLVPRARFIPAKDIPQWLVLRSNWFSVDTDGKFTEPDSDQRPAVAATDVMHGDATETLQYYLTHPNIEDHIQRNILQ